MKLSPLAVAALAVATLVPTAPAHADPAPTCDGLPATIVATHGQRVVGTSGNDVIVAVEPKTIDAGAGDDVVCVLGSDGKARVDLGAGGDTLSTDTSGSYRIDTGDAEDVALGHAPAHDSVTTGGGASRVVSGAGDLPDDDTVTLGGLYDELTIRGVPTGQFSSSNATTPTQFDSDRLRLVDHVPHRWRLDGSAGTVSVDGAAVSSLSGFESIRLKRLAWTSFAFTGTNGRDVLIATGTQIGPGPLTADLGEGDDSVFVAPQLTGALDGGTGHDDLMVRGSRSGPMSGSLVLPLDGLASYNSAPTFSPQGFENVSVDSFADVLLDGTRGNDTVSVLACHATVRGGAGNDHLYLSTPGQRCAGAVGPFVVYGGPGDDTMVGTRDRDVLIGGSGRDVARGGAGSDRCVAEVRRQCES